MTYGPEGFYITCDDALCAGCFRVECGPDGERWTGFEGWTEPVAIFADDESDTPTHCSRCEALIEHNLTGDGYDYVAESILRTLAGEGGRPAIVKRWADVYGEDAMDNLLDGIRERVSQWPDVDPWSPCPGCFAGHGEDHAEGCPAKEEG